MLLLFCLWMISGIIGAAIGGAKDAAGAGFLLGLLFGPLGWLLALLPDGRPKCPYCRGRVDRQAWICMHCRQPLRQQTIPTPPPVQRLR